MEIKRIFLVGFMGSGKSTLGRCLKTEMAWQFVDLDEYFETVYQTGITQYFADCGEDAFRKAERTMLKQVIGMEKVIIATGGGTPCYFDNMALMNTHGLSIYIKLSVDTLVERLCGARQVRPLIAGKSREELKPYIAAKLAEREPFYNRAKVIVDAEVIGIDGLKRIIEASGTVIK